MENERLTRIEELAARVHEHDRDKQARPYIEHLHAVASTVSNDAKAIAWLHDALEDHPYCLPELERVLTVTELTAVILLRHRAGDSYDEYIERIATWPGRAGELAREVKRADIRHNVGRLTPALETLRDRYTRALDRLT